MAEGVGVIDLPELFNAASYYVDRQIEHGRGSRPAIYYEDQVFTYSDVCAGVNRAGQLLRALGVRREDRVMIILPDCPEWVFLFFGAMKIGAVPIPTNVLLRSQDYLYLLNDSRARVLVVGAEFVHQIVPIRARCEYLEHVLVADAVTATVTEAVAANVEADTNMAGAVDRFLSLGPALAAQSPQLEAVRTRRDEPAFWLYSSGTTGFPKGTVHLHRNMVACSRGMAEGILHIQPEDICFSVAKLFFAYGLGNGLYFPFGAGAATVLSPHRPVPALVLQTVTKTRPTLFFAVPTAYNAMLQLDPTGYDLSSVRQCVSGGEPLPAEIYRRWLAAWNVEILDGMGMTESLHNVICNRPGQVKLGSSGRPVPGYAVRLVNEEGAAVGPGEIGSLMVKGGSVAAYYWCKREQTARTFRGEWLFTGDKYRQDEDGYYWYAGRSDDMLKVGGIWVSPFEVESALLEHPAVLECSVVGAPDGENLIKPKAFVVLRPGYMPDDRLKQTLQDFTKQRIAHYKYPRWIEFVDALPKTATGKVQRFKLRQPAN